MEPSVCKNPTVSEKPCSSVCAPQSSRSSPLYSVLLGHRLVQYRQVVNHRADEDPDGTGFFVCVCGMNEIGKITLILRRADKRIEKLNVVLFF